MFGEISSYKPTSIKTLKIYITSLESRNTLKITEYAIWLL